jgi:hypothetical protein
MIKFKFWGGLLEVLKNQAAFHGVPLIGALKFFRKPRTGALMLVRLLVRLIDKLWIEYYLLDSFSVFEVNRWFRKIHGRVLALRKRLKV